MITEIEFFNGQIAHYQKQLAICERNITHSSNPFWWEEKRVTCESRIIEAERTIGVLEVTDSELFKQTA